MMYRQLVLLAMLNTWASSAPTAVMDLDVEQISARAILPFKRIIAFGDDFTDNGQGSWAHGITGNTTTGEGKNLWGAKTWTDGPVAVTNLAGSLGIPLTYDYAFGSAGGGAVIGSVCSNGLLDPTKLSGHAHLLNKQLVPSALQQVANYTNTKVFNQDIANTLHFFWTGNNDMIASLGWVGRFTICDKDTLCHPGQQTFITQVMGCMNSALTQLLKAGAKHILVPNVYPRNYSPWMSQYISPDPGMIADFGGVISAFNTKLQALTKQLSTQYNAKVMYYDVNKFMTSAYNDASLVQGAGYNYTCVDGCPRQIPGPISNWNLYWNDTIVNHQPDRFYWMTTVMPSATVFKAIAAQMVSFLNTQY